MRALWTGILVLGLLTAAACGDDDNHSGNDAGPSDAMSDASAISDGQVDAYVPPAACDDGLDNDDDGFTDFPDDPGCSDATDTDEYNAPNCGTDGQGDPIPVREIPSSGHLVANTVHGSAWYEGSCGGGGGSGELIYRLTVSAGTAGFRISTDTGMTLFDTVVYVRRETCDASSAEVACKDDVGDGVDLNIDNPAPGTYYIFVDGADAGTMGQFGMEVQGLLGEGTACDPSDDTLVCGTGMICIEPTPGAPTVCVLAQCSDGIDNDGDGITDFPNEPGCETPLDHDETDSCPGVGCPECADGADNDGDGLVDYPNDPGCASTADTNEIDECVSGLPVADLPPTGVVNGTISQSDPPYLDGTCAGGSTGERVYALSLPLGATYVSANLTSMDMEPVLYLRFGDCAAGQEFDCGYNMGNGVTVEANNVSAGTLFIVADAQFLFNNPADFSLSVTVAQPPGAPCQIGNPLMGCGAGSNCLDVGGGVWECVPTYCNDGIDNDGDGYADYPNDPGCDSVDDIDEIDSCDPVTNPIACPACFNGTDDDLDGQTDYPDDLGCSSAADNSEANLCTVGLPFAPLPPSGQVISTLSQSSPSYLEPGCLQWGSMEEDVYVLALPQGAQSVQATLDSFDMTPVLHVRQGDCSTGTELGCQYTGGSTSTVSLTNVSPGPLFFVADAEFIFNFTANYTLNVSAVLTAGASCVPASTSVTCPAGTTCTDPGVGFLCQ